MPRSIIFKLQKNNKSIERRGFMETAYVDRYREELSDIFSRIVKIEIYFGIRDCNF